MTRTFTPTPALPRHDRGGVGVAGRRTRALSTESQSRQFAPRNETNN